MNNFVARTLVLSGTRTIRPRALRASSQISRMYSDSPADAFKDRIPVIDVSGLQSGNEEQRRRIGQDMVSAASQIGFFYVQGHGVGESLLSDARDVSRQFFGLPMEAKQRLSIRNEPSRRGYQFVGENVTLGKPDQHEAFDLYRDMPGVGQPSPPTNYGVNKWPSELPSMERLFNDKYVPKLLELGGMLMRGIALGLELPERHFQPFFTSSFWIMRLIRYPPMQAEVARPGTMGCGTHTDYGILTILNQDLDANHNSCLEAQMRDGSWVSVPPREGALAVNIGDMLALWTRGILRATPHRVNRPSNTSRVAVPFFFEPNYDAIIEPLELKHLFHNRVDEDGTRDFKPVRYGDHVLAKVSSNFDF